MIKSSTKTPILKEIFCLASIILGITAVFSTHSGQTSTEHCLPVTFISQFTAPKDKHLCCGHASLMMLLIHCAQQKKRQPAISMEELYKALSPDAKGVGRPAIIKVANEYKWRYKQFDSWETLKSALTYAPVMMMTKNDEYPDHHWIVLVGYTDTNFIYLDPYATTSPSSKKKLSFAQAANTCNLLTSFQLIP